MKIPRANNFSLESPSLIGSFLILANMKSQQVYDVGTALTTEILPIMFCEGLRQGKSCL
jgi:hypothetical protein